MVKRNNKTSHVLNVLTNRMGIQEEELTGPREIQTDEASSVRVDGTQTVQVDESQGVQVGEAQAVKIETAQAVKIEAAQGVKIEAPQVEQTESAATQALPQQSIAVEAIAEQAQAKLAPENRTQLSQSVSGPPLAPASEDRQESQKFVPASPDRVMGLMEPEDVSEVIRESLERTLTAFSSEEKAAFAGSPAAAQAVSQSAAQGAAPPSVGAVQDSTSAGLHPGQIAGSETIAPEMAAGFSTVGAAAVSFAPTDSGTVGFGAAPARTEDVKQEPDPSSSERLVKYVNVMEEVVADQALQIMKKMNMCCCNRCFNDVVALTLNALPPKYVVTPKTALYVKAAAYGRQYQMDLMGALSHACMIVSSSPRHE